MPRKAPKEVVEHRITLGDFERKELTRITKSYKGDKIAENVPNYILGVAGLGAAAALGVAAYAFYRWAGLLGELPAVIQGWTMDFGGQVASFITGNPLFRATRAGANATTEQEVLDAYNPVIADVDAKIEQLKSMPFLPKQNELLTKLYTLRAQLVSQREKDLRRIGDPTGGVPDPNFTIDTLSRLNLITIARQKNARGDAGWVLNYEQLSAMTDEELRAYWRSLAPELS